MAKSQCSKLGYEAAGASDIGKRRTGNEDAYGLQVVEHGLTGNFVVCDGMGGAAGGEVASSIAVEAMLRALGLDPLTAESMQRAVSAANASVYSTAERDMRLAGMGTTLVALATRGQNAWIAHVGDSRCYRLREGRLKCLTQDHSLVDEQVRLGQMTRAQAAISPMRNVITRAVGTTARVIADISEIDILPDDIYLLASDGLTREVSDVQIAEILNGSGDLERLCSALIKTANNSGGGDNITCLLVRANRFPSAIPY